MGINMKERVEADKEIKEYLDTTDKSETEKQDILEKCWKDDNERAKWLNKARANKPKEEQEEQEEGDSKASASHSNSQQRQGIFNDIKKGLIIDAQAKAHDAIKHGGIDPLIAVNDVLSDAINMAIEEGGAMARAERRK